MDDTQNLQDTGLVSSLGQWYAKPFNTNGSALNWILFLGLIIIAAFLWNLVIITAFPKIEAAI